MNYKFDFDSKNSNTIIIKEGEKIINYIACPCVTQGCDIINFGSKVYDGYTFDFDGLVLITTKYKRELYYKGEMIAFTIRKKL
jgi:hypothetical protein